MTETYTVLYSDGDAFRIYSSLSDLLSDGYMRTDAVEIDNGLDVITTTIGELEAAQAPEAYVRGTATVRATTAALQAGDRVLTLNFANGLEVAHTKTGSVVRTVAGKTAVMTAGGFHRSARRYSVQFTDGTQVANLAPVQSWHVLAAS